MRCVRFHRKCDKDVVLGAPVIKEINFNANKVVTEFSCN